MEEIKGLKVVHTLPGRVRLKVDQVKGNPTLARRAEKQLAKVPGIKQVEAAAKTGSLLIHYDLDELCAEASLGILEETLGELFPEIGIVSLISGLSCLAENPRSGAGAHTAGIISNPLKGVTANLDSTHLLPITLALFGLRALLVSEKLLFPAWYDYFWFAFSSFYMVTRGFVEERGYHSPAMPRSERGLVEGTGGTAGEKVA
jgi:hypothetical protein